MERKEFDDAQAKADGVQEGIKTKLEDKGPPEDPAAWEVAIPAQTEETRQEIGEVSHIIPPQLLPSEHHKPRLDSYQDTSDGDPVLFETQIEDERADKEKAQLEKDYKDEAGSAPL